MKRIAVLILLVMVSAGTSIPAKAQGVSPAEDTPKSQKAAKNQQKATEKYQRTQQKAQQKAQRKADKDQQKAMKKYEMEQRKLLKNANRPAKLTS